MYEIIWSPIAKIALFEALNFTIKINQSNTYAIKILNEIKHIESLLKNNEFIGSYTDYPNTRKFIILKNYTLFYTIDESQKQCNIVYFWDNRKNTNKLKEIL